MGDRIKYDPFDKRQNPYHIEARIPPLDDQDPECGYVLGWKNERWRNGSGVGWEGWTPIEYGDKFAGENGEKLKQYISDPPQRMRGPDRVDNLVRRADTVLCRIPADWFDARQENSATRSRDRVNSLTSTEGQEILAGKEGVTTLGTGLKKDKSPTFGDGSAGDSALKTKLSKVNK